MTLARALVYIGPVGLAGQLALMAYGRWALSLTVSASFGVLYLVAGILVGSGLLAGLAAVNVLVWLVIFWWRGPRQRRRARKLLGDESRQLRAGLLRRLRQRRIPRPGWQPQPSR